MEDLTIRRRNRLRQHYTTTSNVLLFGYRGLPDGAKLTYQVIDSFDWQDGAGLRKGFAFPSLGRLADIRGVDKRSIRRHLAQLEEMGLITRQERSGRPNLLIIEDPSAEATAQYLSTFGGEGEDTDVRPARTKLSAPTTLQEIQREERQISLTKIEEPSEEERGEGRPYEHVGHIVREKLASLRERRPRVPPERAKREYLAQEMVRVLGDPHSLGSDSYTQLTLPTKA
jgi:DNA-binding MarR family transcriptional regulator